MKQPVIVNSPVSITAMRFGKDLLAYPRRMEYDGATYVFTGAGLKTSIRRSGRVLAYILTMSDGRQDYCLKSSDFGRSWTLISIMP